MRPSENPVVWRLLRTLAQTENLTRAEDVELSAALRLVTALERDLGVTLLDRSRRPLMLLPAAKRLMPQITVLIDTHRQLVDACGHPSMEGGTALIRLSIHRPVGRPSRSRTLQNAPP